MEEDENIEEELDEIEPEGGFDDEDLEEDEELVVEEEITDDEDTVEELKRISLEPEKLAFFHRRVKKIVEDIYPGQWDFRLVDKEDFVSEGIYILIIHFPEITIRNSEGNTHKIQDIFVRFTFRGYSFFYSRIEGYRTKLSTSEVVSTYCHSHLPGTSKYFQTFCLGTTSYADLASELAVNKWNNNPEDWEIRFEAFLHQLTSYLSWESIEGTPHRRISNIGSGNSRQTIYSGDLIKYFDLFMKFIVTFKRVDSLKYIIDHKNASVQLLLTDELEQIFTISSDKYCYKDHLGNFYDTLAEVSSGSIPNLGFINFKGQKIIPTYSDIIENKDSRRKYANRQIVNYIKNELERRFRKIWFEETYPVIARRNNIINKAREAYYSSSDVLKDYTVVQSSE